MGINITPAASEVILEERFARWTPIRKTGARAPDSTVANKWRQLVQKNQGEGFTAGGGLGLTGQVQVGCPHLHLVSATSPRSPKEARDPHFSNTQREVKN